ncbi:MAG: ribosomal RNA small subunit methyltransferase A, partial [Planctomycetes bacterium]|nr:ribosomal RNA small subunit methyltransferase A [Planctomycetota bacterium]
MARSPAHSQTLSFLVRRFREAGIEPRRKLGQNFLIDLNLRDLAIRTADVKSDDVVLEVGTGTGSFTVLLAEAAAAVVTVELDPQLFALAGEELHALANVHMLHGDALKNKNRINPAVLEAVEEKLHAAPGRRFKLVANLPYNIATPILSNLLALPAPPRTMTVTIQKELADRIVAVPGTKDYGSLAIWVQSQCRAEIVRIMPPSVFWPRP